jgi:hypothetical protein
VRAHRRLVGAHRGAEADRPADPPERDLRRVHPRDTYPTCDGRARRAHELLATWRDEVQRELPSDVEVFDAHTHLGDDIDGMRGRPDELLGMMDEYGVGRAFMFCLDEPDRHPGFRAPNDRTLAYASESNDRLIPFVRLDLNEDPITEAERCLAAGARGIKLHPRAQKISLQDERLMPVFQLACERNVPILIHGGRGACRRSRRTCTRSSSAARRAVDHRARRASPTWEPDLRASPGCRRLLRHVGVERVDLLDFYRQMPPEQIVYASDYPYARQPNSLLMALRTARLAGSTSARSPTS